MAASAFMRKLLSTRGGAFFSAFTNQQKAMGAAQALSDAISGSFGVVPIGSIIAWTNHLTGTPALPDGWAFCNGSVIADTDSPLNGQTLPALNGTIGADNDGRFLRGTSGPSGSGVFQVDQIATHAHGAGTLSAADHQHPYPNVGNTTGGTLLNSVLRATAGVVNTDKTALTGSALAVSGSTGTPTSTNGPETRPINYGVRWIMRIK